MDNLLKKIIEKIKQSNEKIGQPMALDDSNERLLEIFHDLNNFLDYELIDDEEFLINKFGLDGYELICDAENGIY
jgi:hypothetical protein